jgi:signal transduction histidine kinase
MTQLPSDVSVYYILLKRSVTIALIWTILCFLAASWNISAEKEKTLALAQREARTVIDKDQALRFWATDHHGIYVPVTKDTPPNENLSHIPERDITTPSGRQLTLMNPAYMLRQVMHQYGDLYKTKGHLTSLKLVNHTNAPDDWESKALHQFETGREEVMAVTTMDGGEFLRLMVPMYTKTGCLDCHGHQGYKEGDVRGGVSVSIPLASYRTLEKKSLHALTITHAALWWFGLFAIALIFTRNKKRRLERLDDLQTLENQSEKIKIFAYSVAHDLKNPVVAIHGLANLMKKKQFDKLDDKGKQYCEQIIKSSSQICALVDQINLFISAKEQPLTIEPLDFPEVCQTVMEEYAAQLQARRIEWFPPPRVAGIRADRMAIIRIIRNLVDNALKYSGERLSRIAIDCEETPKVFKMSVANDGNPIAPEACRDIFIKFKRNCDDQKVRGTGLGLAIIKELAGLHGGDVWVESDGREGATFYFTIARAIPAETRPRQSGPSHTGEKPSSLEAE